MGLIEFLHKVLVWAFWPITAGFWGLWESGRWHLGLGGGVGFEGSWPLGSRTLGVSAHFEQGS